MVGKSDETWNGIPRSSIKWHPSIDYKKCNRCLSCFKKCKHGVYSVSGKKPVVASPNSCVVGCTGCQSVCPTGAISHPPESYLISLAGNTDSKILCNCGGGCE